MVALSLDIPTAAWTGLAETFRIVFGRRQFPSASPEEDPDPDATRRAFILEMVNRNPDAFRSEMDVQCMMHTYPGRF